MRSTTPRLLPVTKASWRSRCRAPYEAGNRGASWLKIKRAHTLDLIVLAAEWGHGRRTGKLSNLHLGALDPATGEYVMLGKTFKGLTDAMLEWQTKEFLAREIRRDDWTVHIRPNWSWRLRSAICRRARAIRAAWRYDSRESNVIATTSGPEEADTMDSVRKIFRSSAERLGRRRYRRSRRCDRTHWL